MQRLLGGERWRPGPRYGRLDTANGGDTPSDTPHNVVLLTAAFLAVVAALSLVAALVRGSGLTIGMVVLYALLTATLGTLLWHRRRVQVFFVAFQIRADYKAARQAARALDSPTADELQRLWAPVHERSAQRMHGLVIGLAGLWVKTAQLLATRADILPDAFIRRFKTTQDTMPAQPFASIQAVIASELREHGHGAAAAAADAAVVSEVFEWVDPQPLASASIAQVHRARLRAPRREVVIKVQHEGVDALMMHDLETVRLLTNALAWLEPDMDFRPLLDAWCREVPKELDFRVEAQNMAEISANLSSGAAVERGNALHVDASLPRVLPDLTSRRLLVMSYEEGARLTDPDSVLESGVDIAGFIESIARAYAKQMFIDGMYNADPHPGNFLISTQAHRRHEPILLDFGLCTRLTPALRRALAKLVVGVSSLGTDARQNQAAKTTLVEAFNEMGWSVSEGDEAQPMLIQLALFLFRKTETLEEVSQARDLNERERLVKMAQTSEAAAAEAAASAMADTKRLLLSPIKALPGELIFFQRVLQLLRGLAVQYSVQLNFIEVWAPFARQALGLPIEAPTRGPAAETTAVAADGAAINAAGAGGGDEELDERPIPGAPSWLMGFDDDGDLYYRNKETRQIVWDQPPEVAQAEAAAMAAGS